MLAGPLTQILFALRRRRRAGGGFQVHLARFYGSRASAKELILRTISEWAARGRFNARAPTPATMPSARAGFSTVQTRPRLPLHIASLSLAHGIADSVWLKAARLVSRLRPFGGLRASRASFLCHRC